MSKRNKRDYSGLIIWAAAGVSIFRYMGAFISSDVGVITGPLSDALHIGMGITGAAMGLLDALGAAYLFTGWRAAMPRNGQKWPFRFKVETGLLAAMLVSSLIILTPYTVSRTEQVSVGAVLPGWLLWVWALAVNAAPFLILGGAALSTGALVTTTPQEHSQPAPDAQMHVHDAQNAHASQVHKAHICPICTETFKNHAQMAAHVRWEHPSNGTNHNHNGHETDKIEAGR